MLGNNIKALRRKKGYSQETLAEQLHVVRQTVSKWEKGLSVPDAQMLERMAELFEVPVSVLLGAELPEDALQEGEKPEDSALVQQLAILNGQLAEQSARRKLLLRRCLIGVAVLLVVPLLLGFLVIAASILVPQGNAALTTAKLTCELDGETYTYEIIYDENFQIHYDGGDAFISDHVNSIAYDDASMLIAQIEDYFTDRGGTCNVEAERWSETAQQTQTSQ